MDQMVQEPRPFRTIISLETALLLTQGGQKRKGLFGRIIMLQSFCVACRQKQRLRILLSSRGLQSDRADVNTSPVLILGSTRRSIVHHISFSVQLQPLLCLVTSTWESFEPAWTISNGHVAQYFKKSYVDIIVSLPVKCRKLCYSSMLRHRVLRFLEESVWDWSMWVRLRETVKSIVYY